MKTSTQKRKSDFNSRDALKISLQRLRNDRFNNGYEDDKDNTIRNVNEERENLRK